MQNTLQKVLERGPIVVGTVADTKTPHAGKLVEFNAVVVFWLQVELLLLFPAEHHGYGYY